MPAPLSLQVFISSTADARAFVQHLAKIKRAWQDVGAVSVTLLIAEPIRRAVDPILAGAVSWCTRFDRVVKLEEGCVFFELPHFREPSTNGHFLPRREVAVRRAVKRPLHPTRSARLQKELVARGSPLVTSSPANPQPAPTPPQRSFRGQGGVVTTQPAKPGGEPPAIPTNPSSGA